MCLLPFLLLPVNDEQHQQEKHNQDKNNDASYGSYLVGVSREGSAGTAQAVQVSHYNYTSLITPGPFPAWAAVAGPRNVVTGGVVQAVADLAASIPICALGTLVLAVPPHEARPACALPADVVAVGSVLTLAD